MAYIHIAILSASSNYRGDNTMKKRPESFTILISRGGGNKEFPNNTLEAFINAYIVDKNVMMETDVSITKDGGLYCHMTQPLTEKPTMLVL